MQTLISFKALHPNRRKEGLLPVVRSVEPIFVVVAGAVAIGDAVVFMPQYVFTAIEPPGGAPARLLDG